MECDPPIGADVDLRDFQFMPLDVVRLWDSDLAGADLTGDEFRAAVLLWCKAWHQVPAGSLPDDDGTLARYAGFGRRDIDGWLEVRDGALHGFEKCSDGRFYHSVICEKAAEAWGGKQKQRARTRKATATRKQQIITDDDRNEQRNEQRNVSRDDARLETVTTESTQRNDDRNDDRNVDRNGIRDDGHDDTRNVHQGTGTGKVEESFVKTPKDDPDKIPKSMVENWNEICGAAGLPKAEKLTQQRKVKLRKRFAEDFGGEMAQWEACCRRIAVAPHLIGDNDRGWRAFLDWVLKPENLTKILEGNYDPKAPPTARPDYTDEQWRRRCAWFKNGGFPKELQRSDKTKFAKYEWPADKDGPPPGTPGCFVPPGILSEMGFET